VLDDPRWLVVAPVPAISEDVLVASFTSVPVVDLVLASTSECVLVTSFMSVPEVTSAPSLAPRFIVGPMGSSVP